LFSAQDLAHDLNGTLIGDPSLAVTGLCSVYHPEPSQLAFIRSRSTQAAIKQIQSLPQMTVLIEQSIHLPAGIIDKLKCTLIIVEHAQLAFVKAIPKFFAPETVIRSVHPTAIIDPTAVVGLNVAVGPFCNIGPGVRIGDDCIQYAL
jgi:UDP-3-O-[3-hydroxymyristoyl] glucosamine N-acyltransferase